MNTVPCNIPRVHAHRRLQPTRQFYASPGSHHLETTTQTRTRQPEFLHIQHSISPVLRRAAGTAIAARLLGMITAVVIVFAAIGAVIYVTNWR